MKRKLVVTYEIDSEDYEDIMQEQDLTLEEALDQLMLDGELELNELPITDFIVEDEDETKP
jgi:hypothetical protein